MRILVTGTDGYIGAWLGPTLIERGHTVVGLDTGFYRAGWLYNNGIARHPATLVKDIRRITTEDLAGFEAVVHLAELSNDPLAQHKPEISYQINHHGSVALARLCKQAGIQRFVYTSSCSVYGVGSGDEAMTEESPTNPQTAYAHCKVLVERDVSAMADDRFSPTFLRNATAYGPSPRMRFDIVLNNLAGLAWTTREIKLTSDGTPWRPLVHVRDICEAIASVLEAPREVVHNQTLNVGDTQENYRVREIAQIVSETFTGCALTLGKNDSDNRSYRVSFDKIREVLPSFECRRTARIGAQELHDVFQRISLTEETFKHRAFTRLKQLQYLADTGQLDAEFFWK
ncbi:MAG: NAD-dependent epimerase/dehydratase family protein [Anaerolineales bacterium]